MLSENHYSSLMIVHPRYSSVGDDAVGIRISRERVQSVMFGTRDASQ